MLCLENGVQCLVANIYYCYQQHYHCHLINDLPEKYFDLLQFNARGKFIGKTGKLDKQRFIFGDICFKQLLILDK